jgi:L-idonate 5-dehydrogenase
MSGTMKAAVLHGARDVRVQDYPLPELAPGQALVRVRRVGMCGSDLHYFQHGYCAGFVPTRPFVLGHELSAEVAAVADDVASLRPGLRVAVNPARACGECDACRGGRRNLCPRTVMLGSASTRPPTDGAFAELVSVRADQCHPLPDALDDAAGAMIEPLAVALHAVRRAGPLEAKRVLLSGAGTVGLLSVMTARALGAASVVAMDISPGRRAAATRLGADQALDPRDASLAASVRELAGDGFDVVIEAAGAPASLRGAFELVRRGGTIVQVGTLGAADVPLPANQLMNREVQLVGSFRYGDVFGDAIALVERGAVRVDELVSEVFPLADAAKALERAADSAAVIKVQIEVPRLA